MTTRAGLFSRFITTLRPGKAVVVGVLLVVFFGTPTVEAQTTNPAAAAQSAAVATPTPASAFDAQPLRRTALARGEIDTDEAGAAADEAEAKPPATGFGTFRVLMSLGIVVALIFAMKLFGQKLVPGATTGRGGASRAVEMLARSAIGPKQQVLLVRVGRRRVLVIGDCAGKLAALDHITDADEIAELTAQLATEKAGVGTASFASLFGKSSENFDMPAPVVDRDERDRKGAIIDDDLVDASVASTQQELQGLLAKVRRASNKLGS